MESPGPHDVPAPTAIQIAESIALPMETALLWPSGLETQFLRLLFVPPQGPPGRERSPAPFFILTILISATACFSRLRALAQTWYPWMASLGPCEPTIA